MAAKKDTARTPVRASRQRANNKGRAGPTGAQRLTPDFVGLATAAIQLGATGPYGPISAADNVHRIGRLDIENANGVVLAAVEALFALVMSASASWPKPWANYLIRTLGDLRAACLAAAEARDSYLDHPVPVEQMIASLRELLSDEHAGMRSMNDSNPSQRRSQPDGLIARRQARTLALAEEGRSLNADAVRRLGDAARTLRHDPARYWKRSAAVEELRRFFESNGDARLCASFFYSVVTGGNVRSRVDTLADAIADARRDGKDVEKQIRVACDHVGMPADTRRRLFNYADERTRRGGRD